MGENPRLNLQKREIEVAALCCSTSRGLERRLRGGPLHRVTERRRSSGFDFVRVGLELKGGS